MPTIQITCSEQILLSLKEDQASFATDLRMTAAAKFYEMGRLSSGRAAELAGISRITFLRQLADYKISVIDGDLRELTEDLHNA